VSFLLFWFFVLSVIPFIFICPFIYLVFFFFFLVISFSLAISHILVEADPTAGGTGPLCPLLQACVVSFCPLTRFIAVQILLLYLRGVLSLDEVQNALTTSSEVATRLQTNYIQGHFHIENWQGHHP
jgi:hypothetical protein